MINKVGDVLSLEAISKYFSELFFNTEDRLDKHKILDNINDLGVKYMEYKFESISKDFKFIDNEGIQIIIPHGGGELLVDTLKNSQFGIKFILRKLNGFSINIPEHVVEELVKFGDLCELFDGIYILNNLDMYDLNLGFDKDKISDHDYVI